ncbi:MAG: glycosyltransferase family 2 protein [Anaerolineae bacterium]|nr:glycosyltransferase family 2 protein [Anaerolineae bacterium]
MVKQGSSPAISVVIPLLDERENIEPLYQALRETMEGLGKRYEIIFVDDGSTDGSYEILKGLRLQSPENTQVVQFRRNFGKTAALAAGFRQSRGEVIVTLDADMQDDPREIPKLLALLEEGYDLVSAWRRYRKDPLSKTLPSRIFNGVVCAMTGVRLHDLNSGFKAYRREVAQGVKIYGELHRFIPILAHWRGYRVGEVEVVHHPRRYGRSKYGLSRLGRGFVDFLVVLFLTYYLRRPLQLFGTIGALLLSGGFAIGLYLTVLWFLGQGIGWRPLLFLAILFMIVGVQLISIGLLGEMIRNFAYQPEEEYSVRRVLE